MRTMGDKVHSHDSSCIYSIENQMGTLLSSPCQLGYLSHLRLSHYTSLLCQYTINALLDL